MKFRSEQRFFPPKKQVPKSLEIKGSMAMKNNYRTILSAPLIILKLRKLRTFLFHLSISHVIQENNFTIQVCRSIITLQLSIRSAYLSMNDNTLQS